MDALMAFYGSSNSSVLLGSSPELQRAESELWSTAVAACTTSTGESARVLLLPAMNEMFGDVDMERMAFQMHPPIINFAMLGIAATVASATYVIIELEHPRAGLFRVDPMDEVLRQFRASIE
jgi:hypothetical protein